MAAFPRSVRAARSLSLAFVGGVPELGPGFHLEPIPVDGETGTVFHSDGEPCDCLCECDESPDVVAVWTRELHGRVPNEILAACAQAR